MTTPSVEYLVMARKWRPQVFEDVAGQNHVIRTLQNAVKLDRIAHAFIFSGPRGVGKTSVARILAKALNCEQGPTPTPCQVCTHCREITEGIALDVHEIDGASNRGIDEIRELRENIKFLPASSRYKVYIIDEVHMLTREAFNALLKTLEEPPPHVVFIFATTETHKIPATILSRCQCFDFRRISLKEIGDNLRTIAAAEGIAISDKGLSWIATAGDGSMRDSQSIFDQIVSYAGTAIADGNIEEILGLTDRRFVITIAEAVLARNAAQCLKLIDEGYYAGLDMQVFYQMLVDHFRNLVLTKVVTGAEGITEMTQEDWSKLQEQTGKVSRETLQRLLEILMAEEETMRRTQSPRLVLEMALTRMAYLAPLIPIDEILARMASLERSLASGAVAIAMATGENSKGQSRPVTEVKGTGDSVVPTPPISIAAVREQAATGYGTGEKATAANANGDQSWEGFKAFVKPPLSSKLDPGQLLSLEGDLLTIGFQKDYLFFEDIEKNQKEVLSKLARSYFQRPELEIKIEALHNDSAGNNGKIANGNGKAQLISDIRQEALKHPLVQKVMDIFENAEIRDVIPRQTVTEGEVE
ncbi:MAG: DNA polymerase III subunit gamma/tau [Syntrophales bacterium]|jgi:DNA polymerase-3 subunit gamma/tau|nr:DNA polymerase III subunit gamma/tau [Syntrophales bacterium]MCK9392579.1 DNA polymerase III subunit gamma/tau [Syntrophales bacterium]